ncbi:NAD(P)-dependent alcohol dehydrogenase [Haloactinomyces albus]|uniref:Aryl-alcohol dehydrogenase n=1 Tax=Haloactinomyces albus TaxID=1352928 RepID=A0AAE3ZFU8_9ACTN|nr:NAD(P)-dependent alcohol dehydrogenase [Haloactinomyces albus]MDR7304112.1 aryl-alcohol dehydrogenase [Haloactinomyces albus]
MSITATAAVLSGVGEDFELREVSLDEPRPDEVLVRMVATGLCGTDVGVQEGHIPFPLPGVLGHEGAGVVERVGATVDSVQPGDQVLLSFTSCGSCRNCRTGHPAYCETFLSRNLLGGQRADGSTTLSGPSGELHGHFFAQSSFATCALADERGVTKVDPHADLSLLAPLGCGVQTGAGAVWNSLKPEPGSVLAVFGAGAVGLSAIMAAALSGTTNIVAVDLVADRLELAHELGATATVNSRETDVAAALAEITGGRGIDYAIDSTGNTGVLHTAVHALAPLGVCAAIGAPPAGSTVEVDVNFLLNGRRVIGVTEGDSTPQIFLPALVDLIGQGRFPLQKLVRTYEFTAINEAAAAVKDGSTLKPVLTFESG